MLFEEIDYSPPDSLPELGGDHVFRYCTFEGLNEENTLHVDSTFLRCTFKNDEFYWTLFNGVLFSGCELESCTFRGVSFADCRFIDCTFKDCVFTKDNLGGSCTYEDTLWAGCSQTGCTGWEGVW